MSSGNLGMRLMEFRRVSLLRAEKNFDKGKKCLTGVLNKKAPDILLSNQNLVVPISSSDNPNRFVRVTFIALEGMQS